MDIVLLCLLVFALLAGAVLLYRDYYVKRNFTKLAVEKYKVVEPLIVKLNSGVAINPNEILTLVKDASLRHAVFRVLEDHNSTNMFPADYFTCEKGAESFLVNWLEFPTELGTAPAEITLLKTVSINVDEPLHYYVFQYKTNPPHWAAQYNWLLGVAGPYRKESMPYDVPSRIFSRFNPVHAISAEQEAQWVHNNISRPKP
jgi:hypothetical protein